MPRGGWRARCSWLGFRARGSGAIESRLVRIVLRTMVSLYPCSHISLLLRMRQRQPDIAPIRDWRTPRIRTDRLYALLCTPLWLLRTYLATYTKAKDVCRGLRIAKAGPNSTADFQIFKPSTPQSCLPSPALLVPESE